MFDDFDDDDIVDSLDVMVDVDTDKLQVLQDKIDAINAIEDPAERKAAAKDLVRALNGES